MAHHLEKEEFIELYIEELQNCQNKHFKAELLALVNNEEFINAILRATNNTRTENHDILRNHIIEGNLLIERLLEYFSDKYEILEDEFSFYDDMPNVKQLTITMDIGNIAVSYMCNQPIIGDTVVIQRKIYVGDFDITGDNNIASSCLWIENFDELVDNVHNLILIAKCIIINNAVKIELLE